MKRKHISFLIKVAESVNSQSVVSELQRLAIKSENANTPVVLPLVGEFSSGKTTLINALTDSHALETATRPTTASIYEIHFGAPSNCADILYEDGRTEHTEEVKNLKNENLKDAKVVTVFDTSKLVSPFTIIVDTPGISSSDPKHRETLVDFLPSADGIILTIDINQQLTKSLSDFLKTVRLTDKEVYVLLTKSDTKSQEDIEKAKNYFAKNCDIDVRKIATVSAKNGELTEFIEILKDIESRKEDILRKVDEKRLDIIAEKLNGIIGSLLDASTSDEALENKIKEQKALLDRLHRQIERLIRNISDSLEPLNREESRKFEDQVFSKLTALINSGSSNYDAEAISSINMSASAILGDYRQKVMSLIASETASKPRDGELSLNGILGVDLSTLSLSGLSYGLNLNDMGHENDKWIKTGIIAVGTIAAVGAIAATGGAAASGIAGAADEVLTVGTIVDVADTVTDIGSAMHNDKVASRIENVIRYGKVAGEKYSEIEHLNEQGYGDQGTGKGIIDSLAGLIAEKTMSKPQRSRAIRNYIDGTLMPEFKIKIASASEQVLNAVRISLDEIANSSIEEITSNLQHLKEQLMSKKEEILTRMSSLRDMQTQLLTLE